MESRALLKQGDIAPLPGWAAAVASFQLAASYLRSSIARDRRGFCVGVATITLVVVFSALLMSAIQASSLIFLKLSEDQAGESDAVITAEATPNNPIPFLNATALAYAASFASSVRGLAPRWPLLGIAINYNEPSRSLTSFVLGMDSAAEEAIGLGRGWKRRALGERECYASSSLLREIGLAGNVGDLISVNFDIFAILDSLSTLSGGGGGGTGGGSGGNATAASQQRVALVRALLGSAGVDLTSVTLTIDAADALQAALVNGGLLGPAGAAFNATQFREQNPGLAVITIDLTPLLAQALLNAANALSITGTYTVVDEFDGSGGKFASLLGNAVVLEAKHMPVLVRQAVAGLVAQVQAVLQPLATLGGAGGAVSAGGAQTQLGGGAAALQAALDALSAAVPGINYPLMKQFALEVDVMMAPSVRLPTYLQGSASAIDRGVAAFTGNLVSAALGPDAPVNVNAPLADTLGGLQFIALFLTQIFIVVLFVLALLGAVVIFSLVLGDVEARTYELGMLRALGMKHGTLAQLLALQTAAFVGPGVALGLAIASLLHVGIAAGVRWFASLPVQDWPDAMPAPAWIYATVIGAAVPSLAVVVPIRRALTGVLRDALDLSHNAVSEMTVRIMRLADVGVAPAQLAFGGVLALVGFITFYALPLVRL